MSFRVRDTSFQPQNESVEHVEHVEHVESDESDESEHKSKPLGKKNKKREEEKSTESKTLIHNTKGSNGFKMKYDQSGQADYF